MERTERTYAIALRLAAGLAVGLWGVSKLFFVQSWIGPYEGAFYGDLPIEQLLVYGLGVLQVLVAIAIVTDFLRKPAAWLAVVFSVVNLVVSFAVLWQPDNPIVNNPAPMGIKLVWFYFNPIAIALMLIATALLPEQRVRQTGNELGTSERTDALHS